MRVDVDEARRDEEPVGVDRLARGRVRVDATDIDDHTVAHRDVGRRARRTGAVDDRTTADEEVVLAAHSWSSRRWCGNSNTAHDPSSVALRVSEW